VRGLRGSLALINGLEIVLSVLACVFAATQPRRIYQSRSRRESRSRLLVSVARVAREIDSSSSRFSYAPRQNRLRISVAFRSARSLGL